MLFLILSLLIASPPDPSQPHQAQEGTRPKAVQATHSPQVHSDGRVTFRLQARHAKKVILVSEGLQQGAPMSQDERGIWSVMVGPLAPDFYGYKFFVDGVVLADPQNPLAKPSVSSGYQSIVHVPGPTSLSWELNDVSHGVLHRHLFQSKVIGEAREFWVYTPPGYDPGGAQDYPVLYLLHGVLEEARAWTAAGRANVIVDNLIARGESKPMLIVFPLGYGFPNAPQRAHELLSGLADQRKAMDVFAASLLEEVIPLVEEGYKVAADRQARAIAGLSMGGAQAIYIGLNHLDRFAWIGSFSGAFLIYGFPLDNWFPDLSAEAGSRIQLLWMACGDQDFLIGANRRFKDWLNSKQVQATYRESSGAHTWQVWRRNLTDFAPLLFRPAGNQAEP